MELVKELGSRTTVSSTGKSDTRKWGLFKCPTCKCSVERKMQKGVKANTCGASTCRVVDSTKFWNANIAEEHKVKNLPHYSSISDFYRMSVKGFVNGSVWRSFKEFRADMYDEYVKLKSSGISRVTLYVTDSSPLSAANCKFVDATYIEATEFPDETVLHTRRLAYETGVKHHIVVRTLRKMDSNFGTCKYEVTEVFGYINKPTKAYTLTSYQYTRLRDRIVDNVRRKTSTHVYVIRGTSSYKIGTTSDVKRRFGVLTGSNELPLTLLYSKDVTNGTSVEKYLHKKYSEFNTHHEWFELSEDQIKEVIDYLDSL